MSKYFVNGQDLTDIADAIRTGLASTASLEFPDDFVTGIGNISGTTPTGEKTINISANGTTTEDVTQYATAKVVAAVPNTYAVGDEGKVVSSGALVAQTSKNISANGTVDTTLNNQVVVAVPNSYSASDEGKVVSNGALVSQGSDTVTANNTYDTTLISSLTVNVPGSGARIDKRQVTVSNNTPTVARAFTDFIFIAELDESNLPSTLPSNQAVFVMFAYVGGNFINKTGNRGYAIATGTASSSYSGNVSNMSKASVGDSSITFSSYTSQNMYNGTWNVTQIELPTNHGIYSFVNKSFS